jgi:hypothetical protein
VCAKRPGNHYTLVMRRQWACGCIFAPRKYNRQVCPIDEGILFTHNQMALPGSLKIAYIFVLTTEPL